MRRALTTLLVGFVAVLAATTTPTYGHSSRTACGRELWDLKTLTDRRRNLIYFRAVPTTVAAINARRPPRRAPTVRSRGFERRVWRVVAQITEYKLEEDGDIHLVLFDKGAYLIAEMPAPGCLAKTARDRRAIINARRLFESRCGTATDEWRSLGAVAEIEGVGFWDFPHGQTGHGRNYAELHPVTGIRLIAGCA